MSWETASHLHEQSYRAALTSSGSDSIPHDVKYEAVQKLRIVERCKEEFCLLKNDMQNCIDFFDQRIRTLQSLQEHITYEHTIMYMYCTKLVYNPILKLETVVLGV